MSFVLTYRELLEIFNVIFQKITLGGIDEEKEFKGKIVSGFSNYRPKTFRTDTGRKKHRRASPKSGRALPKKLIFAHKKHRNHHSKITCTHRAQVIFNFVRTIASHRTNCFGAFSYPYWQLKRRLRPSAYTLDRLATASRH